MRNHVLVKLIAILMVISMMPYQALATAHAGQVEPAATVEQSSDISEDQETKGDPKGSDEDLNQEDAAQEAAKQEEQKAADGAQSVKEEAQPEELPAKEEKADKKQDVKASSSGDGEELVEELPAKEEPKANAKAGAVRAAGTTPEQQAEENYGENGKAKTYEYRAIELSYTTKNGKTIEAGYYSDEYTSGIIGAYEFTSLTEGSVEDGFATLIDNELMIGFLEVYKQWEGSDEADMPESVTVLLKALANGQELNLKGVAKSTVLNEENGWADTTTWAELPVYDVEGNRISYMLTESAEGDYKAAFKVRLDGNVVDEGEGKILTVNIHDIDNVEVTFVNTLTPPPTPPNKTGDNTPLAMLLLLCLTALTGLLILFLRRRRTA